jgi:hypothetical protein
MLSFSRRVPGAPQRWALLGLSVALGLTLSLPALACRSRASPTSPLSAMSEQEVQHLIEGKVLPGTTLEELPGSLDALGVDYQREPVKADAHNFSPAYGIPDGAFVVVGSVHRAAASDVSVLFVLDNEMRVERVIVEEQMPL